MIQDSNGEDMGVFIPIKDWLAIKNLYPDIEEISKDLPKWEKDLIDRRLEEISQNPERLIEGKKIFEELKRKL
ncbi:hypothetical protein B879_02089 [Cecembia lonarensis LW9]|uniref:Addiction module component n=2 Tax=Cecembia TaxID=1187078 RepID=K1LZ04_CECL9|nr:hypothetical protein B879_02089 [Cecembia lonarensis LW9]